MLAVVVLAVAAFALLSQLAQPAEEGPLIEQGIVDSLGILSLLSFVEEKFSVRITDNELTPENFATPSAMAKMIQEKLMDQKEA